MMQGVSALVLVVLVFWVVVLVAGAVAAWWLVSRMNRGAPVAGLAAGPPPLAALWRLAAQQQQQQQQQQHHPAANCPDGEPGEAAEDCCICLEPLNWAIETNCSHRYCLECFRGQFLRARNVAPPQGRDAAGGQSLWRRLFFGPWQQVAAARLSPVVCALCRRSVDTIIPAFAHGRQVGGDPVSRLNDIADYNNRFVGRSRGLWNAIRDAPVLLQRFCRDLTAGRALFLLSHTRLLVVLLASALYTLSPLDIIPEAVFGVLGLADDALVILVSLLYVSVIYRGIVRTQLLNLAGRLRRRQ